MTDRMDRGQPRTTATRRARHAGRVAPVAAAVVVAVLLGGCSGEASVQVPIRTIQLDDFAGDPGLPARSATSAAPRPAPVVEPDAGSVAGSDTEPEAIADSHSDAVSDSAGDA
ncbi:MAG: hypothetical protein KDA22_15665, partial [Phycisphaerales bacterium]|nr:hypothetical protein [Phycisphaerales bacterium]